MTKETEKNLRAMACVVYLRKFLHEPNIFQGIKRKTETIEFNFTLEMSMADSLWVTKKMVLADRILKAAEIFVNRFAHNFEDWWR